MRRGAGAEADDSLFALVPHICLSYTIGVEKPCRGTRNYIFTFDGIDQLNRSVGGSLKMVQNVIKAIDALKNTAVARCRERIEEAAQKARGLRGGGQEKEEQEHHGPSQPQCGVTSILKRRHGL